MSLGQDFIRHIRMQWYDLLQMSLTVGHSALLQRVLERPKGKSEAKAGESGYHMLEHTCRIPYVIVRVGMLSKPTTWKTLRWNQESKQMLGASSSEWIFWIRLSDTETLIIWIVLNPRQVGQGIPIVRHVL
jgi:hypothetical protein